MPQRIPFVVDIQKSTFEEMDELLAEVCEGLDGTTDWPPSQEQECMAVAGINLLNLQVKVHLILYLKYKTDTPLSFFERGVR